MGDDDVLKTTQEARVARIGKEKEGSVGARLGWAAGTTERRFPVKGVRSYVQSF